MEGSSVRARSDFAESASGGCRASVPHLCRKMSLCNTYRSFAIYLLIVIIISESPVSAFTIRRTTTLRSADLDLAAEGSALLEVKSDLSKLNNERDFVKYGTRKSPIRNSANVVGADEIFASGGNRNAIESTTVKLTNENDAIKPSDNKTIRKDTETTTYPVFGRGEQFKTRAEINNNISISTTSTQSSLSADTNLSNTEENANVSGDNDTKNKSQSVDDSNYSSTSTEYLEVTSAATEKTNTEFTTTDEPEYDISTTISESYKDTTTNAGAVNEETIIYKIIKKSTTAPTETTNFETDSTKFNDIEKSAFTESSTLTESMVGEFSSSTSSDPLWKKYTIIERRRTNPTTEAESSTTETSEELEKAESVSSKVTLDNAVSTTTQEHQELVSDTTTVVETEYVNLSSTAQSFDNLPEKKTDQLLSTQPLSRETTTEIKSQDFLASKRAGYLNLSEKQGADDATTTEQYEEVKFNETELLGSMFELDAQDDGPEFKNSTIVESQSQLADDAIKEELLKEAVLSDHEENSNRYNEDLDKVKPLDTNKVDSLSVKPIGKGALYTSRANYKPMKKIEVQPLKSYVRDPDDNSWRNESLSYLGIVFKAKNASKPFTQVLKNKTEAELNNWSEKENKNEVPDLRERLEKIAEVRKSKKKKLNQFGEMVYSDYEVENSGETSSTPKTDAILPLMEVEREPSPVKIKSVTQPTTTLGVYMYKEETVSTTKKPKKINKFAEYYDTTDEEEADYLSLSKIDLKKFTTRLFGKENEVSTPSPIQMFTKPMQTMLPERRPTLQYFPPRREPQKVNINDYDSDFQKKVNMFAYSEPPKSSPPVSATSPPATMEYKTTQYLKETSVTPGPGRQYKPGNLAKNVYATFSPRVVEHNNRYLASNDESFNRASYVIKHFKDLIEEAVKDDYDKSAEFMQPYTETPLTGVTVKKIKTYMDDDYDYDAHFRRDILNRFVDNFNQNSERFKVDFPVLYNSSVVHMQADDSGKVVASSSAFLKRQYGAAPAPGRPCCDMKVELSPAYELHYYVPDQEEKEEVEKPATMPLSYR